MELGQMDRISKNELYRLLRTRGYEPSDDRLDRLRRANLIEPFERTAGGGAERFVLPEQVERVILFYDTVARLRLEKPTASEIAFWLAADGYDVPVDLVAFHIRSSILSVVQRLFREIGRRVKFQRSDVPADAPRRVGRSLLKMIESLSHDEVSPLGRSLGYLALRTWAGATFRRENFNAVAPMIHGCLGSVLGTEASERFSRPFWDATVEFASLIHDRDNALVNATTRAERDDAGAILLGARDAKLLVKEVAQVFPVFGDAQLAETRWRLSPEDRIVVARYFTPAAAAVLIWARNHEHCIKLREGLRSGDNSTLQTELLAVNAVISSVISLPRDV
jgi:hypothetical protein